MQEIRNKARELMKGSCRVCPVCDGKACAGEVPGMGGLSSAQSFKNNVQALKNVRLNMRLIHNAKAPSTATNWLGIELGLPVVAAPIGGMFNFNEPMQEQEYVDAILQGCKQGGAIGCTGDGVPAPIMDSGLNGISALGGFGIPFIKPWESNELYEKADRAVASGCPAIGCDLDAAGLVTLRLQGRPVGPKTFDELKDYIAYVHKAGKKFIAKGIMTVADAEQAVAAGVDCIVVSNHGGRVFDDTPGTIEVLPAIAKAVKGKTSIMLDGGIRTGYDILKAIALGADIVGIGRPFSIAAIGGRAEGVAKYIATIQAQLAQGMILTGCATLKDINSSVVSVK
ncbi:alpha-hydroxy-acid oxidizing protein [Desulfovibrio sp. OttesenSCG-928-F07]|nr:alpha-hydroxy-acid oxidizing protein [Desulfovibrio sp. OttesenSCG-928-F07]